MTKYLTPDAEGHGTEKVVEAVHKQSGKIKASVVPVKLFATIITIAAGGSAGKEGPCVQIGTGLSSLFADLLKFDDPDCKKLVICGVSARFASMFGTPLAGARTSTYALLTLYNATNASYRDTAVSTRPLCARRLRSTSFSHFCSFVFDEYTMNHESGPRNCLQTHPLCVVSPLST
jgi:hypothetical protein